MVEVRSTIVCPGCGHREREIVPEDACQYFYKCKACGALMKPKSGDCCVFCSYGDAKCPSAQRNAGCCRAHRTARFTVRGLRLAHGDGAAFLLSIQPIPKNESRQKLNYLTSGMCNRMGIGP